MSACFADLPAIPDEGSQSANPLAFKWCDKDRMVLGKRMEAHLRFGVCYWHSFCWKGFDPFGHDGTTERPRQTMDDQPGQRVDQRCAGWATPFGQDFLAGKTGLDAVAAHVAERHSDVRPVSGQQERLENLFNSCV